MRLHRVHVPSKSNRSTKTLYLRNKKHLSSPCGTGRMCIFNVCTNLWAAPSAKCFILWWSCIVIETGKILVGLVLFSFSTINAFYAPTLLVSAVHFTPTHAAHKLNTLSRRARTRDDDKCIHIWWSKRLYCIMTVDSRNSAYHLKLTTQWPEHRQQQKTSTNNSP